MQKTFTTKSASETRRLAIQIGQKLRGSEVIEFLSDLGGGKTTFVGGLVEGLGSSDPVSSPSFTISNVYKRPDGKEFHHFDFYRLNEAGIIANELAEIEGDDNVVVAIEWGDIVHSILPEDRIVITITQQGEGSREITVDYPTDFAYLF